MNSIKDEVSVKNEEQDDENLQGDDITADTVELDGCTA